jgi:hypothetical protein
VVVGGALLGKIGGAFLPSLHPEMQLPDDLIKVRPGRMRDFFRLVVFVVVRSADAVVVVVPERGAR